MRTSLLVLLLLSTSQPAAAAPPPEKPGAALAALELPPCDYKPDYWTPVHSLSKPLAAGDWLAVEAELEELHASFERNHACENRMLRAFLWGFAFTDELPAQLDRWVAARPKSWTAHTLRGAMWAQKVSTLRGAAGNPLTEQQWADLRDWTERAIPDLERAIELHPRAVVAHASLVSTYQAWSAMPEVEKAYRRAIAIDPVSVHLLGATLTALQPSWGGRRELVDEIVAAARQREMENPRIARIYGYPDGWRALALEWRRTPSKGEHERIVLYYNKALRYGEVGSDWHYRRVMNYRELEDYEAVVVDSAYALAADKTWERFWSARVYALAELGRYDEALRTAREALQHIPGSVDLRWYEADVVSRMGRYDEAAAMHRAALKDTRTPHQRFIALGGIATALMKAKRYAEAEPVLAEATQINPRNTMNWHHLAEARWQLGRRADAVPAYEQFIALSEGQGWANEMRMRAQEKIDVVRSGAEPPARAVGR